MQYLEVLLPGQGQAEGIHAASILDPWEITRMGLMGTPLRVIASKTPVSGSSNIFTVSPWKIQVPWIAWIRFRLGTILGRASFMEAWVFNTRLPLGTRWRLWELPLANSIPGGSRLIGAWKWLCKRELRERGRLGVADVVCGATHTCSVSATFFRTRTVRAWVNRSSRNRLRARPSPPLREASVSARPWPKSVWLPHGIPSVQLQASSTRE